MLNIICQWEMQLKTSVRYHYTPMGMAEIGKASCVMCCEDTGDWGKAKYCSHLEEQCDGFFYKVKHTPGRGGV